MFCPYIIYSLQIIFCKPEPLTINCIRHAAQKSPEHATIFFFNSLICLTEFSFRLWLELLINLCKHGDVERNSAEKQLKGSLWLFFPLSKSIEITKPAVASLFNNILFISWFLTQFLLHSSFLGNLDSLFAISVHVLLKIITCGFMLKSALRDDFLGQQLSMMETNVTKD